MMGGRPPDIYGQKRQKTAAYRSTGRIDGRRDCHRRRRRHSNGDGDGNINLANYDHGRLM